MRTLSCDAKVSGAGYWLHCGATAKAGETAGWERRSGLDLCPKHAALAARMGVRS